MNQVHNFHFTDDCPKSITTDGASKCGETLNQARIAYQSNNGSMSDAGSPIIQIVATDESLMPLNCTQEREKFKLATCERYAPHFHSDRSTCQKDETCKPNRLPAYYLGGGRTADENYQLNQNY